MAPGIESTVTPSSFRVGKTEFILSVMVDGDICSASITPTTPVQMNQAVRQGIIGHLVTNFKDYLRTGRAISVEMPAEHGGRTDELIQIVSPASRHYH